MCIRDRDLLFLAETQKIDPKQIEQTIQAYSFFQDILPLMERNPMDLSGGELQRAAFLKILLLKPQIIFCLLYTSIPKKIRI